MLSLPAGDTRRRSGGGDARGDLHEQAHAVAAGPGAERVAAVVVEERRAEHVDVGPRPPAGEALEEGGSRDRIAIGAPGRVAQVRDLRLEQAVVAGVQRPGPREVPNGDARVDDRVAPVVVVAEDAGEEVAHPGPHRARERREVDDVGRALGPRVPKRVCEDQAALGVRIRHLHGQPRGGVNDVRRPDRIGPDHVLARGEDAVTWTGRPSSAIAPSAASTAAPPAMSPFWRTMSDCGLRK